jgi:cell division protease FtsH
VVVPRPDLRGREAILRVHTRRVLLAPDVDLSVVARGTPGFSGADLENLVNEAALIAARRDGESVRMEDFERAKDKVVLGAERRSMVMTEKERRVTAFHEAGHALVALLERDSDPVHKVTIIPRGMALGVTWVMPTEDRHTMTRAEILALILRAMGGRAAEEVVFGHFSTGASDDLQKATRLARDMVCRYGMSERLGPMSFGDDSGSVFLGRDLVQHREYSEEKAREIDAEVAEILQSSYERARRHLSERRDALDRIAVALLERETLGEQELALLLEGRELPPLPLPEPKPVPSVRKAPGRVAAPFGDDRIPDPEPLPS